MVTLCAPDLQVQVQSRDDVDEDHGRWCRLVSHGVGVDLSLETFSPRNGQNQEFICGSPGTGLCPGLAHLFLDLPGSSLCRTPEQCHDAFGTQPDPDPETCHQCHFSRLGKTGGN